MSEQAPIAERARLASRSARADRARARAPRYLFVAFLAITSLTGIRTILAPAPSASLAPAAPATLDQGAESFALEFARAYLTWGPGLNRERAVRPFISSDLAYDAGLSTRGSERVEWEHVSSEQAAAGGVRTVVVAAGVSTQRLPLYLAVPVRREGSGALALTGYPALVGPPSVAHAALPERDDVASQAVSTLARRVATNYLARNRANLAADMAPGARVSLPSLRLRPGSIDAIQWGHGPRSRAVFVTAEATDPERRRWTLTYELGLAHAHSARPTCTYIETAPTTP
jgi:hypothetical protein